MTTAEEFDHLVARNGGLPVGLAAREARGFFEALPPGAAEALVKSRTDQVAQLAGAPARLRYEANRLRLLAARDQLRSAVESGTASERESTRLATVEEMLAPVSSIDADESGRVVEVQRNRQFLSVDPTGQGQAVEVLGDLDEARQVAVLVPGMGNSLESLRGQVDRAQAIHAESGPGTAAVCWLDYASPPTVLQAAGKQRAWAAVPAMQRFSAALETETSPEAKVTLIGHSYGSQVVGQALLRGVRADRVILTGSPGIDRKVRSAAELVPPGTAVFVARSPGDFVSYSEWYGRDPASFPDVVRLKTDGGVPVRWHDQYYRPNSESLRNVGRVVRGDLGAVTKTSTSPAAETKLAPGLSWAGPLRGAAGAAALVYDGVAAITGVKPPPQATLHSPGWTKPGGSGHGAGPKRSDGPGR